ncbi:murein biosynthesis integral membrane protein MurJ [Confluentibacter lentus]|uniref:murein biosynthesis integral membrane protein MurJ n=1 Tax=Confluentibacter lentus TaxID=1699412 RepID=UPI000C291972|nr:lipid II flippase MurJ [Confluentibacter lentus]
MISFELKKLPETLKKSFSNPLIRNIIIVGVISLLFKVIGFYKETMIASSFGLSELLDTFFIAILVPSFVQSVFISSITNIFIPNYIAEIKQGGNTSSLQSVIFLVTLGITLFSIVLAYLTTDFFLELIYPGHTESYYQLIKDQLFIILPCLIFWSLSSVFSGLLEMSNKFFISSISTIFPLLTMIFFLLFLKESLGNMVLAMGTLIGNALGFIFLLAVILKHKHLSLAKPTINYNTKLMLRQLPPKMSSSFLTAMNNYIDQFFAAQLAIGSIAAINYGIKIPSFAVSIVITALGSVLLPHFSRLVNDNLKMAYGHLFRILKWVVGVSLILIVIGIFMSDFIVELLFERNEFTHDDTLKVALIQKITLAYVPFYLSTLIIVKFLTSINKNHFMAWVSLLNLITNTVLNIILVKYFDVYGLAISTTLVLIISSCFYFGYTYKQYKKLV